MRTKTPISELALAIGLSRCEIANAHRSNSSMDQTIVETQRERPNCAATWSADEKRLPDIFLIDIKRLDQEPSIFFNKRSYFVKPSDWSWPPISPCPYTIW